MINENETDNLFLTFFLDNDIYGIEVNNVIEIIGLKEITEVPDLPPYITGLMNLRGDIIPIMDLRIRFKKEFKEYNHRTCVIVAKVKNIIVGFVVDKVNEVIDISNEILLPLPEVNNEVYNKYIKGIKKSKDSDKIILLVDSHKIINEEEYKKIEVTSSKNNQ